MRRAGCIGTLAQQTFVCFLIGRNSSALQNGAGAYPLSASCAFSDAFAIAQSRFTVRGEISRNSALNRKTGEITQFYDPRLLRIEDRKPPENFLHRKDFFRPIDACAHAEPLLVQRDRRAPAFAGGALPGVVHQDAAHQLCRDSYELSAMLPAGVVLVHQPQKGFVHQGGRLQGVAGALASQVVPRQAA